MRGPVFTGLGYGLGGMIASTMLINRWFRSNVATVAGIAAVGSGVAAVILPNVTVALIGTYSLSAAFLFESALALVLGVLVFLLLRNYPRDLGLEPYEAPEGKKAGKPGRARAARRNRNVPEKLAPLVLVAMTFVGCISVGGTSYLAVLFTSEGFFRRGCGGTRGAVRWLPYGCQARKRVVFDRVGTKRGSMFFFRPVRRWHVAALPVGYGERGACGRWRVPLRVVLPSVPWAYPFVDRFAPKGREAKTIKNFQLCYALGGFIFTFLPGFLAEAFGTYLVTYVILLAMIAFAAVVVVGVYLLGDRRVSDNIRS